MPRDVSDTRDVCPRCACALKIERVRFILTGAELVLVCPDCAPAQGDGLGSSGSVTPVEPVSQQPQHLTNDS
jgi:hypothetical protein